MPVSNHKLAIATDKTGHIARAFPASDICWIKKGQATYPADNYIDTKHLGTGKTTKTLIDGAHVWVDGGLIDASGSLAPHPGVDGGTKSNTYLKEAGPPITFSNDVKFEGKGVVRTNDKQHNNHKNTTGFVDGSNVSGQVDTAADYLKIKCSITKIEGECGHGRKLGAPPAGKTTEPFKLDVLGGDTVTLKSERKDLTPPGAPASCGEHTYWIAQRAGQGPEDMLDKVGDEFVISGGPMTDPYKGVLSALGISVGAPDGPKSGEQQLDSWLGNKEREDIRAGNKDPRWVGSPVKPPDKGQDSEYDAAKTKSNNQKTALAVVKNLDALLAFLAIELEPPVVNVSAIACAGAKNVVLRVFPKGGFTFDLMTDELTSYLQKVRAAAKMVEYMSQKFDIEIKTKWLENPTLELSIEYKELTKDATSPITKKQLTKTMVRKAFTFTFKFAPLFEATAKATLPLLPLIAAVASPAIAKAAKWLLDKAGVEINGFVELAIEINPEAKLIVDEYDVFSISFDKLEVVITFSIGLEAKVGKYGELEVRGYLEGTLSFAPFTISAQWPKKWLDTALMGKIRWGAKGFAQANVWGWKPKKSFDTKDEDFAKGWCYPSDGSSGKIFDFSIPLLS